jgi:U3 small nucleolar RNA-associated protein 12
LFDLASSSLIESIKAHEGPIWSLQVRPDRKGIVTGSADKQVKFWDFDLVEKNENAV